VGTPGWGAHMNSEFSPEAEKFTPERWEKPTEAMKNVFLAWGGTQRYTVQLHLSRRMHVLTNGSLYW